MRVLVVHNAYQSHQVGGEDIVVHREIKGLQKALGEENVFEYIVSNDDIRPLKLVFEMWGSTFHRNKVKKLVEQNQIDIVHVHNFFPLLTPSVFEGAKAAGAKVVHTLHNFRWWCINGILYRQGEDICEKCVGEPFGWQGVVHSCYRDSKIQSLAATMAFSWYRLKAYEKHIDAYFVLTHFQGEKLKSLLPAEKLFLKPDPIEVPVNLKPPEKKKDYLFVGRLEHAKGIDLLLSVWAKLPVNFRLNIIGTGENVPLFKKYPQANIRFLGKLPFASVSQQMASAKYLIHPSLMYETFGLTVVEALAMGTPVIALARGTRPEFIQHEKNGFLCEPQNLKETLLKAHDYPQYAQLSAEAYNSAKPFYVGNVIAKQVALYHKIHKTKAQ